MLESGGRSSRIGVITHGSLNGGVEMKLDAGESVEAVKAGKFVVIEGERYDFFALITDLSIDASRENILLHPPDNDLVRRILQGSGTYATVSLKPMLMMQNRGLQELDRDGPLPVKTVPAHFSLVAEADDEDVARIFGHEANEGGKRYFHIGTPLDMQTPVCLDLDRFVERSNAVFGKTGTGKTFLTRLLLSGTIKTGKAVNLIFDMHSEYGLNTTKEGPGTSFVPGLRKLFPKDVCIFSLDPEQTRRRDYTPDHEVYLYADQIEPRDILPLQDTLNLNATAAESTFLLRNTYGRNWLRKLLTSEGDQIKDVAEACGANESSIGALFRKLSRLRGLPFFSLDSSNGKIDVIDALLETLGRGKSVVLEFGRHQDLLVYMLVANVITRRIRDAYEEKTNTYLASKNEADRPRQLMITIEEAHKFLNPQTARETPFGKIAREMRKFYVSLLIVDQRPSGIDEEVLSQIGTKIVAQLNDDRDIGAALVGTSGASGLRQVLASLDSKQQALILGHAVPMPIVIRTRDYDQAFFDAMLDGQGIPGTTFAEKKTNIHEMF